MEIKKIVVGLLEVNSYIITINDYIYIIDPGDNEKMISSYIKSKGLPVKNILLTHAHVDHIGAVKSLYEKFNKPSVFLHKNDHKLYYSADNCLPPIIPALKEHAPLIDNLENNDFEILHTPGHTQGSVCFYFKENNTLISGDTLFKGSAGRTDLPGGDYKTILTSLNEKLLNLPGNTEVFPGHGEKTTIDFEKKNNPFLTQ